MCLPCCIVKLLIHTYNMYCKSGAETKKSIRLNDADYERKLKTKLLKSQRLTRGDSKDLMFSGLLKGNENLLKKLSFDDKPVQLVTKQTSRYCSPVNLRFNINSTRTSAEQKERSFGLSTKSLQLHKQTLLRKSQKHTSSTGGISSSVNKSSNNTTASSSHTHSSFTRSSIRTLFLRNFEIKLKYITTFQEGVTIKMGQTLSEPVTKKESSSDENHTLKIGTSCMQGWRINMEDEHVHKLCLNDEKETHFFAVFDGHGGQGAAQFASKRLDNEIVNHSAYKNGDVVAACKGGFLTLDEIMNKESLGKDDSSGCTAVTVIIKGNKLFCANVGDSRAIASVRGHAQLLSFDHKPNHEREMRRINAAGGFVEYNRVNGNLALSRALGDFVFKKNDHRSAEEQIVTADPDVIVKDITKDHEFIVLACDGIWDVLGNQDVVEFVRERLAHKMDPEVICEELMNRCLATECAVGGMGCDNMTVVIIALKQNGSFEELCKKCTVPKKDPIPPSCLLPSYPDYVRGGISCL